ncbi:MAG: CDP-glycerol glycerophosphotransferase family protein [Coriobacteriia bacterium]|nr:CDP-glycerol glycerophosphotransferase family protein [Coriobacteriia bacterium]
MDLTEELLSLAWMQVLIFANIAPVFWKTKRRLGYFALCAYLDKTSEGINFKQTRLFAGTVPVRMRMLMRHGLRVPFTKLHFNFMRVSIDLDGPQRVDLIINNMLNFEIITDERTWRVPFVYDLLNARHGRYRHGRIAVDHSRGLSLYFRQTRQNALVLAQRKINRTDTARERLKLRLAHLMALVAPRSHEVLLYEKELQGYGESASVLFERLCEGGYSRAYYLLDPASPQAGFVPSSCRQHVIDAFTVRHYYHFFACRTFMGTEGLQHALESRVASPIAQRKANSQHNRFVFLQHGVMYMVSLASPLRQVFREGIRSYRFHRVVVSSQTEAQHFIDAAGYTPESLYITGLPDYDHYQIAPDADRIILMPTWREWEFNQARVAPEQTGYYRLLCAMYESVPLELRERVWVLPHPLMLEAFRASDLADHIPSFERYSDLLRVCKLFITDYSSASFAAFYGGSNVLFFWRDLEECIQQYGAPLMLDERTAFGEVCWNPAALATAVDRWYGAPQDPTFESHYRRLVTYHDGCNTERLIAALAADHLLY